MRNKIYCTICLKNVKKNESYISLKCKHKFHFICYMNVISKCDQNDKCPNCRNSIEKINLISEFKKERDNLKLEVENLELKVSELNDELDELYYSYDNTINELNIITIQNKKLKKMNLNIINTNIKLHNLLTKKNEINYFESLTDILKNDLDNLD